MSVLCLLSGEDVISASEAWLEMSSDDKAPFIALATKIKKPPNCYFLYVKDFFKREGDNWPSPQDAVSRGQPPLHHLFSQYNHTY